jgi:glycosyltransferase involved in cell wall biosynthesis
MKVAYYFRSNRKGVFSIEVLFHRIIASLGTKVRADFCYVTFKNLGSIWLKSLRSPCDAYHITGAIHYVALVLKGNKTVLTIHDIAHYTHTLLGWRKYVYKKLWFDWPLRKVALITTVSEFSKQQLIQVFSIDAAKVKVIHNPFPTSYKRDDKLKLADRPKILQIGAGQHKNLSRLAEAVKNISCELVLVRAYDEALDRSLTEQGIVVTWHFNLTEEEMYALYKACDLVFFASTYEGFGMPIVEAQAIGRAVMTSRCAAMPEVAGEGAVLVDPYNVEEIRNILIKLIHDDAYRNTCIENGYKNLQRFHPDFIAQEYLNLYTLLSNQRA